MYKNMIPYYKYSDQISLSVQIFYWKCFEIFEKAL